MSDLVNRLCAQNQPVTVMLRPTRDLDAFRKCIERGYVHVKFINTVGGTELGVQLDSSESRIDAQQLNAGKGAVQLVGNLTLDYVKVRCIATIDLESLDGTGRLERREIPN